MIDKLIEQLKRHEGFRSKPYKDTVGKLTIGYGRNIEDVGISVQEAETLLLNDIEWAVEECAQLFLNWPELPDDVQVVLANMCFNLGKVRLGRFIKMRMAIADKDFVRAAEEMKDSKWYTQVGRRSVELVEMMRSA